MKKIIFLIAASMCISCDASDSLKYSEQEEVGNGTEISVFTAGVKKVTSTQLTGFNMSYYHDTDELWADGKLTESLKEVKASVFRYPGGAETSYFHWEYPGVPGYRDIWNPKHNINIDDVINVTKHMDTDEFMAVCKELDAEPLLGINVMSGVVNDRVDDSIDEAKRWIQYCKNKGYNVKYWYLDNEVNHGAEYRALTIEEYADLINLFSKELKAVDSEIEIVVNLSGAASHQMHQDLIKLAGASFDIIDIHQYYAWGKIDWAKWLIERPMVSLWTKRTIKDEFNVLSSFIKSSEFSHIKIAVLEWNMGPSDTSIISDYKQALMQAEMFQQMIEADIEMACIWPLIWKVKEGTFPSIFDQVDYEPTPFFYIMKLYSDALGHNLVNSRSTNDQIVHQAIDSQGATWVFGINKSSSKVPIDVKMYSDKKYTDAQVSIVSTDNIEGNECDVKSAVAEISGRNITFNVSGYSFFMLKLM